MFDHDVLEQEYYNGLLVPLRAFEKELYSEGYMFK